MKTSIRVLGLLSLIASPILANAQPVIGMPTAPDVSVACVYDALQYKVITSYLIATGNYETQTLTPAISGSTDIAYFDDSIGTYLNTNRQVLNFLKACFTNAGITVPAATCKPSAITPANSTTSAIATRIVALDVDQGQNYLNGIFGTPPNLTAVTEAFESFYENTQASFCTIYEYASHPVTVTNLKSPSL